MKLKDIELDRIYITSDTHAFHRSITRGTSSWALTDAQIASGNVLRVRDFDTPEQMTTKLIQNFNATIPSDGILFHLGDWSFGGEDKIESFRNQLNVREIHLITGNHDHHQETGKWDHLFSSRQKYLELQIGKLGFCLFHFKIASWNNIKRGWFQLHGHHHWEGELRFGNGRQMDVGVDGNDLKPYKLIDVISMLENRKFVDNSDHHS
jgi:calcineurin-like phosphoesterase family protein